MKDEKYLIETKANRRELVNKILIFGTLVITVIVAATLAGIFVAKAHKAKYYSQMEETSKENIIEEKEEQVNEEEPSQEQNEASQENQTEETQETESTLPTPVYSEDAKYRMKNIYKEGNVEKIAYLTFDDGPSSNITPQILQILKDQGVKATFFVLGSRVELYPELVKQEYNEGHYIANHGYSHKYDSIYSSPTAVLDEYNHTEEVIRKAIGNENYSSHLFRFPGGSSGGKYADMKKEAMKVLDDNNIAHINWNALTNDAVGKPTAESIVNDLKSTAKGKNKIVILMHDSGGKQLTADKLPEIISYLKAEGYEFKNFYDIMY